MCPATRSTICPNNTTVVDRNGATVVTLHKTEIVTYDRRKGRVTFNTGGWDTPTTMRRMNEACSQFELPIKLTKKHFEKASKIIYQENDGYWWPVIDAPAVEW